MSLQSNDGLGLAKLAVTGLIATTGSDASRRLVEQITSRDDLQKLRIAILEVVNDATYAPYLESQTRVWLFNIIALIDHLLS